jgi:hypothetical protein
MYRFIFILSSIIVLTISINGCNSKQSHYSFIVAGHTYGGVGKENHGVHPPFKAKFEELTMDPSLEFGVFTGDIVKDCTEENWNSIDSDIDTLGIPVYFTAGNHDVKDRALFEKRYGRTYYTFKKHEDLFVILDGNYHGWNIEGEQLRFFKESVANHPEVNNIFIFVHQVIWFWGGGKKYSSLRINSPENRSDELKYWKEIHPFLVGTDKNVFLFAGDIGAAKWSDNFMHAKEDNVTFIASGMGGGKRDNVVKVTVQDTVVSVSMILLREDRELMIKPDTFMIY